MADSQHLKIKNRPNIYYSLPMPLKRNISAMADQSLGKWHHDGCGGMNFSVIFTNVYMAVSVQKL